MIVIKSKFNDRWQLAKFLVCIKQLCLIQMLLLSPKGSSTVLSIAISPTMSAKKENSKLLLFLTSWKHCLPLPPKQC